MFDYFICFLLGGFSFTLLIAGLCLHRLGSLLKEDSKSSDRSALEDVT